MIVTNKVVRGVAVVMPGSVVTMDIDVPDWWLELFVERRRVLWSLVMASLSSLVASSLSSLMSPDREDKPSYWASAKEIWMQVSKVDVFYYKEITACLDDMVRHGAVESRSVHSTVPMSGGSPLEILRYRLAIDHTPSSTVSD